MSIIDDLKKLDGVAAYNKQEPSSSDFERISSENVRLVDELKKLKSWNEELQKLCDEKDSKIKELSHSTVLAANQILQNEIKEAREVLYKYSDEDSHKFTTIAIHSDRQSIGLNSWAFNDRGDLAREYLKKWGRG